jgi:hypothetical protein
MSSQSIYDDVVKTKFPPLIQMLESRLDFKRWGFEFIYAGVLPQFPPCIFYRSEQCQVRFRWEHDRPYEEPLIYISYGRLHAPLDQTTMLCNGERCHCWHSIELVLNFLDGLAPTDTHNREFIVPRIMKVFRDSNKGKGWNHREFTVRNHAHIWEHYGQRIFDLFDLRYPVLWKKYSGFLHEYYTQWNEQSKLKGITPIPIDPPLSKVC